MLKNTKLLAPISSTGRSGSLEERDAILNDVRNNIILDETQLELIATTWSLEDRMKLIKLFNETMLVLNTFILEFSVPGK